MAAAAHDPAFAAKVGVPVSVAQEWHAADKARRDKLGKLSAVYGPPKRRV
jgi:hypothetical protein